jgi:hypothetical protein
MMRPWPLQPLGRSGCSTEGKAGAIGPHGGPLRPIDLGAPYTPDGHRVANRPLVPARALGQAGDVSAYAGQDRSIE